MEAQICTFKLSDFEGPLDLLLHLISKAKVDVRDIFVSEITQQYLAYIGDMQELDMDTASEFLAMAATLLYIKSRSLLPKPPAMVEEEEDPESRLIRQIEEYRLFKEAGEKLRDMEAQGVCVYYKLAEEYPFAPQKYELGDVDVGMLARAFADVLAREEETEQETPFGGRLIHRDRFTVRNRIRHIGSLLSKQSRLEFSELFSDTPCREEVVCTFAAMLEMLSAHTVAVVQKRSFDKILIRKVVG
ncbi:MAG: segregation and condensation protein A [Christensenellales bacterium]|jgi:segregation and condensation protein A